MTEEEKKAIEMLNKYIVEHKFFNIKQADNLEGNIEISINLIEKQQKEIKDLKKDNNHQWEEICKLTFELKEAEDRLIKIVKEDIEVLQELLKKE